LPLPVGRANLAVAALGYSTSDFAVMPMSLAAIIVAAGSSSRLGRPKQLLVVDGEPMLQRAIRIAREAGASPIFVVLGANRDVIKNAVDFGSATIVVNAAWEEGIASSIRAGVNAVEAIAPEIEGVLLLSCDQPRVTKEHLRQMIETFASQSIPTAIASAYAGIRGVPAIFPRESFPDLRSLQGDHGARRLLVDQRWPVIALPLLGGEIDIDRPEDLATIK
jgi:CTP:molybdopterin cytidylyltransferase MocA